MDYISRPILKEEAYYGILGQIIKFLSGKTEADDASLLLHAITVFGAMNMGTTTFKALGQGFKTNLYTAVVGPTYSGRKGTAWSLIESIFKKANPEWFKVHTMSGLNTGAGLLNTLKALNEFNCLIIEEEYHRLATASGIKENPLSSILRCAYDGRSLQNMTKEDPIRIPYSNISLIVHSTPFELKLLLRPVDLANGLANRFIWIYSERQCLIPHLQNSYITLPNELEQKLKGAVEYGHSCNSISIDGDAEAYWIELYTSGKLQPPDGKLGELFARAANHILRVSLIYAIGDKDSYIRAQHIQAAYALWEYSYESSIYIFNQSLTSDAIKVMESLKIHQKLKRSSITHEVFKRNHRREEIDNIEKELLSKNLIEISIDKNETGRPTTWWSLKKDMNSDE